jgi:hypothetical protein
MVAQANNDRRKTESRKIVLIDLENMLFGNHAGTEPNQSDRSSEILSLAQARRPGDMLIVGCNPHLAFLANDLFPGAQIVTGKGKDGADNALVHAIDAVHVADRYSELCIVSGDHAFCSVAHEARRAGLTVRVVAPHAGLSTALRVYANTAVLLPEVPLRETDSGETQSSSLAA